MLDLDPLLLIPLAFVLGLMALPILSRRLHGSVEFIDPVALHTEMESPSSPYVFDIRPEKEYDAGHIPGAAKLPASRLATMITQKEKLVTDTKSEPVVLVCQSDLESIRMWKKLRSDGWENIRVLKGGMYKWKRSHMPIEKT